MCGGDVSRCEALGSSLAFSTSQPTPCRTIVPNGFRANASAENEQLRTIVLRCGENHTCSRQKSAKLELKQRAVASKATAACPSGSGVARAKTTGPAASYSCGLMPGSGLGGGQHLIVVGMIGDLPHVFHMLDFVPAINHEYGAAQTPIQRTAFDQYTVVFAEPSAAMRVSVFTFSTPSAPHQRF